MTESSRTINGLIWSGVERFAPQVIQFVANIIIARLLLPSDFGLIAMIMIFMTVAQTFVDSGFSVALIHKQDRNQKDYSTVFFFNLAVAIIFYLVLFFLARPISAFYETPRLVSVIKLISLGIIFSSLSVVQRAMLTIQTNFKLQAKASFFSALIGGVVGVLMAYNGFGVWSLVMLSLSNSLSNSVLLWLFTKWRPDLIFSKHSFNSLFSFGSSLLISGIIQAVYTNIYSLIIGKTYKASDLGFYNRATVLASFIPLSLSDVMYRVIYPIQCEAQERKDVLNTLFHKYIGLSAFLIYPLCISFSVFSFQIIYIVLGNQWLPSANLFAILSIGYMFRPTICINETILTVVGRTKLFLKMDIIRKCIGMIILFISMNYGLTIMALCFAMYYLIDLVIDIHFAKKIIDTSYRKQLSILFPIILVALISGIVAYYTESLIGNLYLKLLMGIMTYYISYFSISYLFKLQGFNKFITTKKYWHNII